MTEEAAVTGAPAEEPQKRRALRMDEIAAEAEPDYLWVKLGNGEVRVASLPVPEMLEFLEVAGPLDAPTEKFELIWRCLVDEDGNRIGKPEDVARLRRMAYRKLSPVIRACLQVNGLGRSAGRIAGPSAQIKNDSGGAATAEPPSAS